MTGDDADTATTEQPALVEAVAGFDGSAHRAEVVVLRRTPGGPWILAGTHAVVDQATVARLTGRLPAAQALELTTRLELAAEPGAATTAWLTQHTGQPTAGIDLTDEQRATAAARFADLISEGCIRHGN